MTRPAEVSGHPISYFLDTVGDGSGDKNGTGDYSTEPGRFIVTPQIASLYITSLHVFVKGGDIKSESYGGLDALTNGITIRVVNDTNIIDDLTNGLPIKTNACWARIGLDVRSPNWGGDEFFAAHIRLPKPLFLRVNFDNPRRDSERIEVCLRDDFTGLASHTFNVHGWVE